MATLLKQNGENYLNKDVKRIILKFRLLHEISMNPSYSYAIIERFCGMASQSKFFGKNKAEIKNDIYNTINALEKSGYIKSVAKVEKGKLKNYCYITPLGKKTLKKSLITFHKSIKELEKIVK